ncbi:MAG: HD domain-containing phosphohydrolase [Candidatus Omnitrophota bacterium]
MNNKTSSRAFISFNFKLFTLAILFLLIATQIVMTFFSITIVPSFVSVVVAIACLSYLWIAETLDREKIHKINIELTITQDKLKESQIDAIMSLVLSQEAKDLFTSGHSERVTKYATELAKELGLPSKEVEVINRAAKLHDIGKIGIRDEILFSKGKLTEEQYNIIKTHPEKGIKIVDPLKFLDKERSIILHHHERFDGKGYPDRLKGKDIPIGARIMAAADSFDAMKSTRPYKQPLSKENIVCEFKDNSGTQFDPEVVKVFLEIIERFYK